MKLNTYLCLSAGKSVLTNIFIQVNLLRIKGSRRRTIEYCLLQLVKNYSSHILRRSLVHQGIIRISQCDDSYLESWKGSDIGIKTQMAAIMMYAFIFWTINVTPT